MFEKFTESARQVVVAAQDEARGLHHAQIDVPHLLLGLMVGDEADPAKSIAQRALVELGVDNISQVRAEVETAFPAADDALLVGQIPFTPEAKQTLEGALREALSLGHNFIATEHVLLALTRSEDATVRRILPDTAAVRETVTKILMGRPAPRHLVTWTRAAEESCREMLDAVATMLSLLERDAVPLFEVHGAAGLVAATSSNFASAIQAIVLEGPVPRASA